MSTDNEQFIPNRHAVSSDCMLNLKSSSVSGKSYRASVPATNGTSFISQQTTIMYIPAGRRNTFLDPQQTYLKFTIQNTSTTAGDNFYLDTTGASPIQSINIYHGSNLLETITTYNVLFNYIIDSQMNFSEKYGSSAALGSSGIELGYRAGALLTANNGTNPSNSLTVCLPVISGLFGLGADRCLPLFALVDDIRIEIVWETNQAAFCWVQATTPSYKIIQPELEICMIELSDEGMRMVNEVTPFNEAVFLHGNSWRHYTATLQASSSGNQSFIAPMRFASLKTALVLPRSSVTQTSYLAYSLASRINPNIATYYWRIGGALIPQKPVTLYNGSTIYGYAEAYMELVKSWHGLSKADVGSILGTDIYNVADTGDQTVGNASVKGVYGAGTTATATTGTTNGVWVSYQTTNSNLAGFAIATEMELFAGRSDVIISGTNTLSSQMFFEFNIVTATSAAAGSYVLDMYANHDIIFVLQDGLLTARY